MIVEIYITFTSKGCDIIYIVSKPLTRFARSLIQGSRSPMVTFEHAKGEVVGVGVTVALTSAMVFL